jgi:hypothetical protein
MLRAYEASQEGDRITGTARQLSPSELESPALWVDQVSSTKFFQSPSQSFLGVFREADNQF